MDIFDGVELSDEQKEKLTNNYDQSIADNFKTRADFDSVLNNRDTLLGEKKAEQEKRRIADAEIERINHEKALKSNDVDSLKSSYEEKIAGLQSQIDEKKVTEGRNTVKNIVSGFVNDNFKDDVFIRESAINEISKRLRHEDGETAVLSADGTLSALSIKDLFTEVRGNSKYAAHIVASKASGGGTTEGTQNTDASGSLSDKGLSSVKMGDKAARTAIIKAQMDERKTN